MKRTALIILAVVAILLVVNASALLKGTKQFGMEVNLLKEDKYRTGIIYTPTCLGLCHLPIEIKFNGTTAPSAYTFKAASDLTYYLNKINKSDDIEIIAVNWLEAYIAEWQEWLPDVRCNDIPNPDSKNGSTITNCTDFGRYENRSETRYRWVAMPSMVSVSKNEYFAIDFLGRRTPRLGNFGVDVVPSVLGFQLPELAWWNASCGYRWPILSNATTASLPFDVNDTGWPNEWTRNASGIYLYNCSTYYPVANDTNELAWENEDSGTGNTPTSVWSNGEKAVWHLNGTTILDSTAGAHNAVNNGNSTNTTGIFGGAINCDGTGDYFNISNHADFAFGMGNFSACIWLNIATDGTYLRPFGKDSYAGGATYTGWFMQKKNTNVVGFATRNSTQAKSKECYGTKTILAAGGWYYICGVRAANILYVYINGVLNATCAEDAATNVDNAATLKICAMDNDPMTSTFNGQVDEAGVWNRALSATEISERYNSSLNRLNSLGAEETGNIAPNVSLNFPLNISWNATREIAFGFTPTDDSGFSNCSLWITNSTQGSFAFNISNASAIVNGSVNTISQNLSDGTYTWNINCCDNATASLCNTSAGNYTLAIDTIAPTSNNPPDQSIVQDEVGYVIGWVLQDDRTAGFYRVLRNGTTQNASTAWANNTNLNVWINTAAIGDWNITILFNDTAGNAGRNEVLITIKPVPGHGGPGPGPEGAGCGDYLIYTDFRGKDIILIAPAGWPSPSRQILVYNNGSADLNLIVKFTQELLPLCEFTAYANPPILPGEYGKFIFGCRGPSEAVAGKIYLSSGENCVDEYNLTIRPVSNPLEFFNYLGEMGFGNAIGGLTAEFDVFGLKLLAWEILAIVALLVIILIWLML